MSTKLTLPPTAPKQGFVVTTLSFDPANSPTDVWMITGSATKLVKIWNIIFSGLQAGLAGSVEPVFLLRRSSLNTGGTAITDIPVPLDSLNDPPTAIVRHYTANPTLGTLVGVIDSRRILIPISGTEIVPSVSIWGWDFIPSDYYSQVQPLSLRGANEQLSVNFAGAEFSGLVDSFHITCIFTEEPL